MAASLILLIALGCMGSPPGQRFVWMPLDPENVDPAVFRSDRTACEQTLAGVSSTVPYYECMSARGYKVAPMHPSLQCSIPGRDGVLATALCVPRD